MRVMRKMYLLPAVFLPAMMVSCMNEEYDLNKPIDTTVNIEGNIGLPVGNVEFISLDYLINQSGALGEDSFIKKAENGDYSLYLSGEEVSGSYRLDNLSLEGFNLETSSITFSLPGYAGGIAGGYLPDEEIVVELDDLPSVLNIDSPVPAEIKSFDYAEIDLPVGIGFSISEGRIAVKSGSRIDFPQYITIDADSQQSGYEVQGHSLVFTKDMVVNSSQTNISIKLTRIDAEKFPQGQGISGGRLLIEDQIVAKISVGVSPSDFSVLPSSLKLTMSPSVGTAKVKKISASIAPEPLAIEDQNMEIGELPEFLAGDDVVLDVYDPKIRFSITNSTPLQLSAETELIAYKNDEEVQRIQLGKDGEIVVRANSQQEVVISRTGTGAGPDGLNIKVDNLSELLMAKPDRIAVVGTKMIVPEQNLIVDFGNGNDFVEYAYAFNYEVNTPLALGSEAKVVFSTDFKGWNGIFNSEGNPNETPAEGKSSGADNGNNSGDKGNSAIKFNMAELRFELSNHLPLAVELVATPIDKEGNAVDGMTVDTEALINSGNTDTPSVSPVKILIKTDDQEALKNFDGLKLSLKAFVQSGYEGITLNAAQGIKINNMKLEFSGGYQIKF